MTKLNDDYITEDVYQDIIDENIDDYIKAVSQLNNNIEEFQKWEDEVRDKFIANYYYRGGKDGWSFGNIDKDVLVKMLQNDIRLFLSQVGIGFSGEIKISYKKGVPTFMSSTFLAIDDSYNGNEEYERFKRFISDYGFVSYKKFGMDKRLYGERYRMYTDKFWEVITKNKESVFSKSSTKKNIGKSKQ